MAKKNNLFLLIKSLSKAEKRYFRLFAAGGGSQNYVLLFDAIERQQNYDEEAIKTQFQGYTFAKQLHVTKNYLSKLILKSLRNFHAGISKDAELKDLLRDIEILFRKELFDHCEFAIDKAIKLAVEYEKLNDLVELCAWRRKLLLATTGTGRSREEINSVLEHERHTIERLLRINEYWNLTINIFELLEFSRHQPLHDPAGRLDRHPLLKNVETANSLQATMLFYHCLQTFYFFNSDLAQADESVSKLIAVLEQHPSLIRDNPRSYITALNNKAGVCLHAKRYEEIPALLAKVKAVPSNYGIKDKSPATIKLLLQSYNLELEMYRDTGRYREGLALIEDASYFLQRHRNSVTDDYRLLLYYQFSYMYFMAGDFDSALHWLNEVFRGRFDSFREDILSYSHLLRLLIHFELGNIIFLKYAVDSCRRFLQKKRRLHKFETDVLKFFSRASLAPRDQYQRLYRDLQTALFGGGEDNRNAATLDYENFNDYLDFKSWLAAKIGD